MTNSREKELVKRIAKLAKQNRELEELVRKLQRKNEKLIRDNEKIKAVLENLSPGKLDKELYIEQKPRSLKFEMATVLFADIHGFSKISDKVDSEALMDELDEIFFAFNAIVKKYNIEKIKTIGDTYMCSGGIPVKNITNPVDVVMAAIEMQSFLRAFDKNGEEKSGKFWELKLGIHTGPVTAQSSGKKKVTYDIKGDTVNTASRIESVVEVGEIIISVMTYELVKEFFVCEYYGKLPVKYKDDLEMYIIEGIKPELSVDGKGLLPNKTFDIRFGLIQFTDMQEVILDKLEEELPGKLYYHNVKHTVDIVTEVELIGWGEGISDEEILLIKTAGLFHDVGHVVQYADHEYHGTLIAREMLPKYNYSEKQIDRICDVIMSTKLPPKPKDLLQSIICDADLDYLGRSDFIPVSNTLFKELKEQNMIGTLNDWNKLQVKFITGHQYFTKTARNLREVNKQKQIERISSLIED
ncbi:MAG: HD domain-containing protein [Bacteroidetes bacterium]|nr:HD domain-containing protein [Bacteroidota bacterium]